MKFTIILLLCVAPSALLAAPIKGEVSTYCKVMVEIFKIASEDKFIHNKSLRVSAGETILYLQDGDNDDATIKDAVEVTKFAYMVPEIDSQNEGIVYKVCMDKYK